MKSLDTIAARSETAGSLADAPERRRGVSSALLILAAAIITISGLMLFGDLPKQIIGLLVMALTLLLMAMRVPIGIAMILASALGLFSLGGIRVVESSVQTILFSTVASWSFSVLPLFVFMGIAMWRGGLTGRAYAAAQQWLGKLPGGLGIATIFAGAGLAAGSGSSVGISYAVGKMAIPEMLRNGYKPSLATGSVAVAGTLGALIPPSVVLVIYAGIAQVGVGPQLIAAIVPGLMIAFAYVAVIFVWATVRPSVAPRADLSGVTWKTRFQSLAGVAPVAIIVVVVLGGMLTGMFTSTEAAAFGALIAFVVSWLYAGKGNRSARRTLAFLRNTTSETVIAVAGMFLLLIGVAVLTRMMALSGVAQGLTEVILDANLGRIELLLILLVVYLALGTFLDPMAMMLLTVPLLAAPLQAVGVDMIWFGVFIVILAELGIVSPPVGLLTFIVHRLAQDPSVNIGVRIGLVDVFKGVIPFVGSAVIVLLMLIFFPELTTWLPSISGNGS